MKISSVIGKRVVLEAESPEEADWLFHYFKTNCKRFSKKFPLKDNGWTGGMEG